MAQSPRNPPSSPFRTRPKNGPWISPSPKVQLSYQLEYNSAANASPDAGRPFALVEDGKGKARHRTGRTRRSTKERFGWRPQRGVADQIAHIDGVLGAGPGK